MSLQKIKDFFHNLIVRIGIISETLVGYINVVLGFGDKIESVLHNPITQLAIKEFVPSKDEAIVAKIEAAIPKAIAYLTKSKDVLEAGTPDQVFTAFMKELQKDAPGLQKTKIMRIAQEVVGFMDGNSLARSVYDMLVQKYFTGKKLGVPTE